MFNIGIVNKQYF